MMGEDIMPAAALGRMASLGDLYNAKTDKFTGVSLLQGVPKEGIIIMDDPFSDVTFSLDDNYSDKLCHLDLTASLKASFLGGLLSLEGSGKYLRDEKKSARSVRSTLLYKITTKREKINFLAQEMKGLVNSDFDDGGATHVVTEIQWGANLQVVVDYANDDNDRKSDIAGTLQAELQKVFSNLAAAGSQGSTTAGKSDILRHKSLSVKIYGDIVSDDNVPHTIEDALSLAQKMPSLVQRANDGKGRPVTFYLTPLSTLEKNLTFANNTAPLIRSLEVSSVTQFMDLFDDIHRRKQALHDLLTDMKVFENYLPVSIYLEACELKAALEREEADLRGELASLLVAVRSGLHGTESLFILAAKYKNAGSADNKKDVLRHDSFRTAREKINLVRTLLARGVQICHSGRTVDSYLMGSERIWIVLYYRQPTDEADKEIWLHNRYMFLQLLESEGTIPKDEPFYPPALKDSNDGGAAESLLFLENLKLPAEGQFSIEPICDLYSITLYGRTHSGAKSFEVRLADSAGNTLLRFHCNFTTQETRISSGDQRQWRQEEVGALQMTPGGFFELRFWRTDHGFKIEIDHAEAIRHRTNFTSSATDLRISVAGQADIYIVSVVRDKSFQGDYPLVDDPPAAVYPALHKPSFLFVDCDVLPEQSVPEKLAIYRYENGRPITRNMYQDHAAHLSRRIAISKRIQSGYGKPNKRAFVILRCPGAGGGGPCKNEASKWSCGKCEESLEFGFDSYFYCSCGRSHETQYLYRCDDPAHGAAFRSYPITELKLQLDRLRPFKELNILLLGTTGVGKSTWINSFANYLQYSTLDKAEKGELISLIPSSFQLMDENFIEHSVRVGEDPNEVMQAGCSATQCPTSYSFLSKDDVIVRLIDTPGIGDTRGIEQDKKNFENIIKHLSYHDEIHGICILIKPNEARMTLVFEFCIKELLAHLHRDAAENIVFCFTNARSTFYRPGDSFATLRSLLKSNTEYAADSSKVIELAKDTVYCMDNEAFRFLAAVKNGIAFNETERLNYAASWQKAVQETGRLLTHIGALKPHKTNMTVSLNHTRQTIILLTRPLADISKNIQTNIAVLDDREQELRNTTNVSSNLRKNLYVPGVTLEQVNLKKPQTVCASPKCTKTMDIYTDRNSAKITRTIYSQVCHDNCGVRNLASNELGSAIIQKCRCIKSGSGGNCSICHCPWTYHMHMTYSVTEKVIDVKSSDVEASLAANETKIQTIQRIVGECRQRKRQLEDEQGVINVAAAKFAVYLKMNAITPYNDALARYMDHLIVLEEEKVSHGGSPAMLEGLQRNREIYAAELEIIKCALDKGEKCDVTTGDMQETLARLSSLPLNGKAIRDSLRTAEEAEKLAYRERAFKAHKQSSRVHSVADMVSVYDQSRGGKEKKQYTNAIKNFFGNFFYNNE
ncbi:putative Neoverrucotoxin subunit beta [Hypsibius exemplaris]|uniref:Neoverrucotoxin subunit beta n=1 Tax=Hypsibius exemplaris TaxID=2072580 RepID=A0A1W0X6U3_HYPEX|nr:putative Neoverrucotoxin subunit beta [Hypsibius exemplaris]